MLINEAETRRRVLLTQVLLVRVLDAIPDLTKAQRDSAIAEWRKIEAGK